MQYLCTVLTLCSVMAYSYCVVEKFKLREILKILFLFKKQMTSKTKQCELCLCFCKCICHSASSWGIPREEEIVIVGWGRKFCNKTEVIFVLTQLKTKECLLKARAEGRRPVGALCFQLSDMSCLEKNCTVCYGSSMFLPPVSLNKQTQRMAFYPKDGSLL